MKRMSMIPLKCPDCAGDVVVENKSTTAFCSYCGRRFLVQETVPQVPAGSESAGSSDYEIIGGKLVQYHGADTDVIIPSGVKIIGGGAFQGTAVEHVFIPDSVTEIEDCGKGRVYGGAFDSCAFLTEITIPGSVAHIGKDAFRGCKSLQELKLCEGIKWISEYAFEGCVSLREVRIPTSVEAIENNTFKNCTQLESASFASSDTTIGSKLTAKPIAGSKSRYFEGVFPGTPFLQKVLQQQEQGKQAQEQAQQADRMQRGVCRYCGGQFGGMFSKKCSACGKPKDY